MKLVLLICTFFLFLSCSKDKKESPKPEEINSSVSRFAWAPQALALAQIQVIDQFSNPIPKAQVLIGTAMNAPFSGNLFVTNTSGVAQISKDWAAESHITIEAAGYIRLTLLNQKPGDMTIRLSPTHLAQQAELQGEVINMPVVNGDKLIDFGLVMPGLTRADILNFDLDQVVSPYMDTISIAGQKAELPANVSLPTQKESYIFSLTISKPVYRIKVPVLGPQRFFATRGRFVFKDVADELRKGKPFYDLINQFTILGGGLRDVTLTNASSTLNIPGNELDFNSTLQVKTPTAKVDEILLVLATSQVAETMIPTDIKKATSGQTLSLSTMTGHPAFVVNVIKRQSEFMKIATGADRLSASILPFVAGANPKMLPLVDDPTVTTTDGYLVLFPPAPTTTGIHALATSVALSDLVEMQSIDASGNPQKVTVANPRWEVIGLGWNKQIQLPKWPLKSPASRMRVGINFIGSDKKSTPNLDDSLIDAANYVSHASTDF